MTLVRFKPNRESESIVPRTFSQFIDNFFDEALQTRRPFEGSFMPGMDIRETEKAWEVDVALPGMTKDDIKIDLEDRMLTISGERKSRNEEDGVRYHLIETHYGRFSRTLTLPGTVNRDTIDAKFSDGILKIRIEKDEKSVTRQIQIK